MKHSEIGEDLYSKIKNHSEIIQEIQEIKEIEEAIPEFDISDPMNENEFIDIDNNLEEFQEIKPIINPNLIKKPKTIKAIKIKKSTEKAKKKTKPKKTLNPTIFHLKINNEGKLENLDIKKPKIIDKKKINFISKRLKRKKEKNVDKKDKKIKIPNFKNGFSKIRKAIPSRGNKSKDSEKTKK